MASLKNLVRIALALPVIISVLALMTIGHIGQLLIIPLLKPVNKDLYRKVNQAIVASWWAYLVIASQKLSGFELIITGDAMDEGNALILCNHQSGADIIILLALAYEMKALPRLKWFAKDSLKYIPIFGSGFYLMDAIFVKRSWFKDKDKIMAIFRRFIEEKVPFWILCFVEGTRFTQEKAEKDQAFFKNKNIEPFSKVLRPKPGGFVAALSTLSPVTDYIYDLTFAYPKAIPTLFDLCLGKCPKVHVHCQRFTISELPKDKNEVQDWLFTRFAEKNRRLEKFEQTSFLI